jgi:hypothetical protein
MSALVRDLYLPGTLPRCGYRIILPFFAVRNRHSGSLYVGERRRNIQVFDPRVFLRLLVGVIT